jgi:hypothetical protein
MDKTVIEGLGKGPYSALPSFAKPEMRTLCVAGLGATPSASISSTQAVAPRMSWAMAYACTKLFTSTVTIDNLVLTLKLLYCFAAPDIDAIQVESPQILRLAKGNVESAISCQ